MDPKYFNAFDHLTDYLFVIALGNNAVPGPVIFANQFAIQSLGYTKEELLGREFVNLLDPELNSDILTLFTKQFSETVIRSVLASADGVWTPVEAITKVIGTKDQKFGLIHARDIGKQIEQEEELGYLNDELENQKENFQALIDNLTQTQEQLVQSEKMVALGQLIAGIAHEINTPLGAIKASVGNMDDALTKLIDQLKVVAMDADSTSKILFFEVLQSAHPGPSSLNSREKRQLRQQISEQFAPLGITDPVNLAETLIYLNLTDPSHPIYRLISSDKAVHSVELAKNFISILKNKNTIHVATEKASKVVFALKKFIHQDQTGEKSLTDIVDGIETVLTLYHNQIKYGIEVLREYQTIPHILCYADEINQVWTNIIHNALQAMGQSGTLRVAAYNENNEIVVKITDTGPGIPHEIKDKIFEPFFTTKKRGEGSGLGLDIVKKIVEKHDGQIYFESEPGKGTSFFVKLPINN